MIIYYILAILLLVLDQWSKLAIVNNFALHEVKEVLPGSCPCSISRTKVLPGGFLKEECSFSSSSQ